MHHGVVDEFDAEDLSFRHRDGGIFGKGFSVERPEVAGHVAGETQFNFANRS